ncbi:curli assembly protein CsgF [Rasiella rasia]|uniref:Curli production assembly/transport component CsgF n=1 Tax=Rasiella rasia TaxID=2744027 RepID=A0A6G6GPR1_9FLAO|nr:curli assembly protein CsgF [Rasiella rasia]QIE60539.1 curli assembly protein CsgF [Rasiella rasia]
MKTIVFLLFLGASSYGFGQQLVYTPKNPAFGGDPFNYTWLLNSANAQNQFEDSQLGLEGFEGLDGLLDNQLFGQFGANQELPPEGTSRDGNLEYEVYQSNEGLVINILDITTGEQTQIIVPNN